MKIDPREIKGKWAHGWALDVHTINSFPVGCNPFGHTIWDTTRSEIGELLYKLKYNNDSSQIEIIAQTVVDFILGKDELKDVCAVIAAPPSITARLVQPVPAIAAIIGNKLNISAPIDYLQKIKQTAVLKNMKDSQKRAAELQGAFKVTDERYNGKHVLIFDDLFDTGQTLSAICDVLILQGKVSKISVVTVTETKSKK